jgi:hypothetical protein
MFSVSSNQATSFHRLPRSRIVNFPCDELITLKVHFSRHFEAAKPVSVLFTGLKPASRSSSPGEKSSEDNFCYITTH